MGKVSRSFVVILAGLALAVASLAGTSFADSSASKVAKKKPAIATLAVENPNVSVKKKGSDEFVPATDGQKLRQGDTIQTDATGRATVNYTDDAYTRLDVNTTLTIEKLTEDQGARQIKSSLDTGRTWNRTEALTESGEFEQSGAGATAAVAGTAFMMTCETPNLCTTFAGFHQVILRSENGETRFIPEFGECTSDDAVLCAEVRILTPDEVALIAFVQEMYIRDLVEHNFGPGPTLTSFNIIVENGQVVAVTQVPPTTPPTLTLTSSSSGSSSSSSSTTTTTTTTTTLPPPPAVAPLPVDVQGGGTGEYPLQPPHSIPTGNLNGITTEDEAGNNPAGNLPDYNPVIFTVNLTGPVGSVLSVKFTQLADASIGAVQWSTDGGTTWNAVIQGDPYDQTTTMFQFIPLHYESPDGCTDFSSCYANYPTSGFVNSGDGTVSWTTSFKIVAVDQFGQTSSPVDVPITVIDDICNERPGSIDCTTLTTLGGQSVETQATVTTQERSTTPEPTTEATTAPTEATTAPTEATTPTTEESTTSPTTAGSDG